MAAHTTLSQSTSPKITICVRSGIISSIIAIPTFAPVNSRTPRAPKSAASAIETCGVATEEPHRRFADMKQRMFYLDHALRELHAARIAWSTTDSFRHLAAAHAWRQLAQMPLEVPAPELAGETALGRVASAG
jgi:hypothetical protein